MSWSSSRQQKFNTQLCLPKELVLLLSVLCAQDSYLFVRVEESCSLKHFRIHRLSDIMPATSWGPALAGVLKLCPEHSKREPQGRAMPSLAFKSALPDPHVLWWWWTRNSSGHGVYFSLMSSKQNFPEYLPPILIYDFMGTLQASLWLQGVSGNDNEIPAFPNGWLKDISLGWGFCLWIPASKLHLTQGHR